MAANTRFYLSTKLSHLAIALALVSTALSVTSTTKAAACKTHTVQDGQSLWRISKRYNVTVEAIQQLNNLDEQAPIKPGMTLQIPSAKGKPPCQPPTNSKKTAPPSSATASASKSKPDPSPPSAKGPIIAPPAAWTQTQKSAAERGVNPCNTPDVGNGIYDSWDRGVLLGQLMAPQRGGITKSGQFDVMFHFHGHDPVRKEWVQVMDGAVLVGVTLGIGSGPYETTFRDANLFEKYVKSVEQLIAKRTSNPKARARKIGLSAWSAGYGAVGEILRSSYGKRVVDSVILLDGLHCGYQGQMLNDTQVEPFLDFAKRAAAGSKFMFVSHSSIIPPDYASTTETANYLIHKMRGKPRSVRPRGSDPMGLDLISRFDRGNFHVRGYKGNDKMDHCAHIGLLRDVLKVHIKRRWNSPKGYKNKK